MPLPPNSRRVARPCACRGVVEADPADPVDVERAVQGHQSSVVHQQWAAAAQLRGELVAPLRVAIHAGSVNGHPLAIELRRVR